MKRYRLNGSNINDLPSFLKEFGEMVHGPGGYWGTNLFQFDDCLFGYGGLEYPCEIIWEYHDIALRALNSESLVFEYEKMLRNFENDLVNDPDDVFVRDMTAYYQSRIQDVTANGYTLFAEIVSIIKSVSERNKHCQIKLVLQ